MNVISLSRGYIKNVQKNFIDNISRSWYTKNVKKPIDNISPLERIYPHFLFIQKCKKTY